MDCTFAHNPVELDLWNYEYQNSSTFSVKQFIEQFSRGRNISVDSILTNITHRFPGYFRYICGKCFSFSQPRISLERPDNPQLCQNPESPHAWSRDALLVHVSARGLSAIAELPRTPTENSNPYPSPSELALSACPFQQFCRRRATCPCAHSDVELYIWELERSQRFTRAQLVTVNQKNVNVTLTRQQQEEEPTTRSDPRPARLISLLKAVKVANAQANSANGADTLNEKTLKTKAYTQSARSSHSSQPQAAASSTVAGSSSGQSVAAAAHPHPPPLMSLKLQMNVLSLSSSTSGTAQHHSQQQEISKRGESTSPELNDEHDDVLVSETAYAQQTPEKAPEKALQLTGGEFYCPFCPSFCTSSEQWNEHCASEKHCFNIYSDRDHCWNYRPPPLHILNPEQYKLCVAHLGDPNQVGDPGNLQYLR